MYNFDRRKFLKLMGKGTAALGIGSIGFPQSAWAAQSSGTQASRTMAESRQRIIIDAFCHIVTDKYLEGLLQKVKGGPNASPMPNFVTTNPPLCNIDIRRRLLDRYPDVKQVINISLPALDDSIVSRNDAIELAKIANEEMAELVDTYPDKFVAAAACLAVNDIDACVQEAERAITQLGHRGIQVFTKMNGVPLYDKKFWPLFELMVAHDLPILIHPVGGGVGPAGNMLGWPFDTSVTMVELALSGVFDKYPNIKFLTHHCGGMIPYFEQRVWWGMGETEEGGLRARKHMTKFYNDTAVYGSTPALMCGFSYFGAEHILFGTDMPLGPDTGLTLETIWSIERMQIPEHVKEKIFQSNAIELFRLAV